MTKKIIEDIITRAFEIVQEAYDHNRESNGTSSFEVTRLVFPKYGEHRTDLKDKTRISEQELRFAFTEACNKEHVFYSVETPTKEKYLFKGKNAPRIVPKNKKGGQSGQFDLVLYDNELNRVCLIEFKSGEVSLKAFKEIYLKLSNIKEGDTDVLRYILHLVKSTPSSETNNNRANAENWVKFICDTNVTYKCCSLENKN